MTNFDYYDNLCEKAKAFDLIMECIEEYNKAEKDTQELEAAAIIKTFLEILSVILRTKIF